MLLWFRCVSPRKFGKRADVFSSANDFALESINQSDPCTVTQALPNSQLDQMSLSFLWKYFFMTRAICLFKVGLKTETFYHGLRSVGPNTIARLLPGMAFDSSCSETRLRCLIKRAAVTRLAVGSCITTSRSLPRRLSYSSRISSFSEAALHVVELCIIAKLSCWD